MEFKPLSWRSISTMSPWEQEYDALERYCETVWHAFEHQTNIAIEIGSYHGRTTAIIAQYFPYVYAIDLWGDIHKGTSKPSTIGQESFVPFIKNMLRLDILESRVHPIVSTSKFLCGCQYLGAELVFIDGSHHYDDVCLDIQRAIEHLDDDGLIVFHDYKRPGIGYPECDGYPYEGPNDAWEGVARAVDEAIKEYELEVHDHTGGIVALRKKWRNFK
jgi:predicted O-methyltransferase YrrM